MFYVPPSGEQFENWPTYEQEFGYCGEESRRRLEAMGEEGRRHLQDVGEQELSLDNDLSLFQVCLDEEDTGLKGFRCVQFGSEEA